MTLSWPFIFDHVHMYARTLVYARVSHVFSGYMTVFCVHASLCGGDLSDTHPLYERHITLQMTLLDGDGPFNCSTLMQSVVNTLNQAAEEEAAYPSSLPLSPSLFLYLTLTLYLSLLLLSWLCLSFALYLLHCICFILLFFFYPLSGLPHLLYRCMKILHGL